MEKRTNLSQFEEQEAKDLMQIWIDVANGCAWNDNSETNADRINQALETLEAMLLIYNVFAKEQLDLVDEDDTRLYTLVAL